MSLRQAQGIVRNLKWYHVGFCLFWTVTFVGLLDPADTYASLASAFSLGRQAVTFVAVVACALVAARIRKPYRPGLAPVAAAALSAGTLLYYLAFFFGEFSVAAVVASAVLIGGAQGVFFVAWQSFFASEGVSRTLIYIPLSALCSVALCAVVSALPFTWVVLCVVVVLPAAAALTLHLSLAEVVPYDVEPLDARRLGALAREMALPVVCVCSLGFVWRISCYLADDMGLGSFLAVMVGMSCATLILTLIELFSPRGVDILRVAQVLFPLITVALLLPSLLGAVGYTTLSALVMFGFEVVNLLLLSACAASASRSALDSTFVYAVCVGPTLIALILGDVVGGAMNEASLVGFATTMDVLLVCLCLLVATVVVVFVVRGTMRRRGVRAPEAGGVPVPAAPADEVVQSEPSTTPSTGLPDEPCLSAAGLADASTTEAAACEPASEADAETTGLRWEARLDELGLPDPLSAREREVAGLVLRGNTVAAVARKLYISENTVRGHMKSIYRKLGVHSRQELIDLLE